jgi:hypothetical protein
MNKFFAVLLFVLTSALAFSEDAKYIDELDGNNWMATPAATKFGFVAGFLNANRAALDAFYDKIDQQNQLAGYKDEELKQKNDAAMTRFEQFFEYAQGVDDIITLLDDYYRNKDNRHIYIWSAIVGLCGKKFD